MATVGLISCVSRKRNYATEAKNLYSSALFTKSQKYIMSRCDRWYVLSAKFGLVEPGDIIDPYEETLNSKSLSERKEWADRVWKDLYNNLKPGDFIVILAGLRYREFIVPRLRKHGFIVEVPMEGLSIGKQLQWLSKQLYQPNREKDLERLYTALRTLEAGIGGKRVMSDCNGKQNWPLSGVYFFFELGEYRSKVEEPRIIRVGTHAVSKGSKATLWNRLRTHRGTNNGGGNHRSSIFRLHIGAALAKKEVSLAVSSWGVGQSANKEVRKEEEPLEKAVSRYIGTMSLLWIAIEDEAGPASDRAYIERNLIGLLAGLAGPLDLPSPEWLGRYSPDERINKSGLWNLDFLDYYYSQEFLDVLDEYVMATIGKKQKPNKSIAPSNWYVNERQRIHPNQLSLFGE